MRTIRTAFILLVAASIASLLSGSARAAQNSVTDDVLQVRDYAGAKVYYVVLDKDRAPKLAGGNEYESVKELTDSSFATVGINAGAWDAEGKMDYTFRDGIWISDNGDAYVGDPLAMTKDGQLIACGYDYVSKEYLEGLDPEWVVTGYNGVIYDYDGYNWDWDKKTDRSFIGQLKNGNYVVGVATGGWTYYDMWNFGITTFGGDLRLLYNLDGGGSCGLVVNGKEVVTGRDVKTAIVF